MQHIALADNPMLDRLAQLETEYGKLTPEKGEEEGGQKKKAEDGEAEEDEPIEEDEDDFQDDDDYYQVTSWPVPVTASAQLASLSNYVVERLAHLMLSVCHFPNHCLWPPLMSPKDRKCKLVD